MLNMLMLPYFFCKVMCASFKDHPCSVYYSFICLEMTRWCNFWVHIFQSCWYLGWVQPV